MEEWGFWSYFTACLFVMGIFLEPVKKWWFNRQIREIVALDRICRLADIGENDLKFIVLHSYRFMKSSEYGYQRRFFVSFSYRCWRGLDVIAKNGKAQRNPYFGLGDPIEVERFMDCSSIEEKVAKEILEIKKGAVVNGKWSYDHPRP